MSNKRLGSTRVMTPLEPGIIAVHYTDKWSAFDRGSAEQTIPGIGEARCACAVKSFRLAHALGLPTHFLEQATPDTIFVQEFSVPGKQSLSGKVHGRVIPLEWLWRIKAKGSLIERLIAGTVTPESLGFAKGTVVTDGMALPQPLLECTTKFEQVDRHLTDEDAQMIGRLTKPEFDEARMLLIAGIEPSNFLYDQVGFEIPDGKCELGMRHDGTIVFVDVFGTQDEDRIIKKATRELFSKDLIREELKRLGYKIGLDAAKKLYPDDKSKWPVYPRFSDDFVQLVAARYKEVALRYAGVVVN